LRPRLRTVFSKDDLARLEEWLEAANKTVLVARARLCKLGPGVHEADGNGKAPPDLLLPKWLRDKLLQTIFLDPDEYGMICCVYLKNPVNDLIRFPEPPEGVPDNKTVANP